MSEHLPECPVPTMDGLWGMPLHPDDAEANCICDRLRACEQRVLDAAREAVAGIRDAGVPAVPRGEAMSLDDWNDGWIEGERDMLAKCIAAVEATRADAKWPQDVDDAIAALRALQEKP